MSILFTISNPTTTTTLSVVSLPLVLNNGQLHESRSRRESSPKILMSHLITCRRSVSNAAPALSASTPGVSALLIGELTTLTEATPTASQVPISSTSSVSVQPLSARRPHRRRRELEPYDHSSSSSRVEGGASQPREVLPNFLYKFKLRYGCPMQWKCWAQIPDETKELVRDKLTVNFDLEDISPDKKSVAGKKARGSKTLLHHSSLKPFSYRLEERRQGSKFPQIDLFKDVYVRPGKEIVEQLHGDMVEKSTVVFQEATSQLTPETPIEDVIVPDDADLKILIEVLDQKLGRRHGKVVWCMGKAGVRETGASSSRSSTVEVNSLKEEVTTLRGQLVAQNERMNMIVQALAMSGLQIPMPASNLAPPLTS
ncbi:unnamed protein product [Malus baccata var. baccata]